MVKLLEYLVMAQIHVDKSILLKYFRQALTEITFNKVHFGFAEPLTNNPVPLDFSSRITLPLYGKNVILAAYDRKIEEHEFSPGDILFTGRNGWAMKVSADNSASLSVVYKESYIRLVYAEFENSELKSQQWYHTSSSPKEISLHIIQALNWLMNETDSDRNARAIPLITALLHQVIEEVEHDNPEKIGKAERTFQLVKEYILQNYHSPINRASICGDLKLNPCYVSSLFTEKTGESLNVYLNRLRMKNAEFILKTYKVSMEQAAAQCGFTSGAYFIKAFKKNYGTTPGVFKNIISSK